MKFWIMAAVISVRAEVALSFASMGASAAAMEWVASASTVMSLVVEAISSVRAMSEGWPAATWMPLRVTVEKPGAVAERS